MEFVYVSYIYPAATVEPGGTSQHCMCDIVWVTPVYQCPVQKSTADRGGTHGGFNGVTEAIKQSSVACCTLCECVRAPKTVSSTVKKTPGGI